MSPFNSHLHMTLIRKSRCLYLQNRTRIQPLHTISTTNILVEVTINSHLNVFKSFGIMLLFPTVPPLHTVPDSKSSLLNMPDLKTSYQFPTFFGKKPTILTVVYKISCDVDPISFWSHPLPSLPPHPHLINPPSSPCSISIFPGTTSPKNLRTLFPLEYSSL